MDNEDKNTYNAPDSVVIENVENLDIISDRKDLLPKWIKFFSWMFLIFGVFVPFVTIFSILSKIEGNYSLFGLETTGSVSSPSVQFIIFLFITLGVCAYGLLFGKDWGVNLCIVMGYVSIGVCLFSIFQGGSIGLELLLLIPYIIKLHKISNKWKKIKT